MSSSKYACNELLFAGFPSQVQCPSFHHAFIRAFFAHYGEVKHFMYDEDRGVGSVTFASGGLALSCYIAVHLSLLPSPASGGEGIGGKSATDVFLIFLEFAWSCPVVNPHILLQGKMSRHLLRQKMRASTEPLAPRSSAAAHVVTRWCEAGRAPEEAKSRRDNTVRGSPNFPETDASNTPGALSEALWVVLKPDKGPAAASGDAITVLDLWWEYYQRYVLHKTEPAAVRIKNPYLNYAQKASVVQEIHRMVKDSQGVGQGDAQHAGELVSRLLRDDVYHSVCGYLCFKLRFRNDPSWASLVRDVVSAGGSTVEELCKAYDGDVMDKRLGKEEMEEEEEDSEAEGALLQLPLLRAASNLIENVQFLRRVRRGEVDAANKSANRNDDGDVYKSRQNHPTNRRAEEEDLYMEVLHTLDGFAPTGTAASLLYMCEDPHTFRHEKGHIGWCELHGKARSSTRWVTCQAIVVALLLVALTAWGLTHVANWMGVNMNDLGAPHLKPGVNRNVDIHLTEL